MFFILSDTEKNITLYQESKQLLQLSSVPFYRYFWDKSGTESITRLELHCSYQITKAILKIYNI